MMARKQIQISSNNDYTDLQNQVVANLEKPNTANVNIPERIIICLDICCDNNSLFHLADGTTFTPINMMKRVLDFFVHTKLAINKKTQFAIMFLEQDAIWKLDFTSNVKNIFTVIDFVTAEENTADSFDFNGVFQLLKEKAEVPEYKQGESVLVPPYVVRLLLLYGRSNCMPYIPQDNPYFQFLKKQPYFNIDILYAHESDCASHKCAEIFDSLQYLDNGYSYVYEVLRNAAKIHDCAAKLLAHPLQRVLQKNTDYSFAKTPSIS
ncbi:BRISC and BRCA1-A complex member 1-like isoform X2 [Plodia interpunctella]|uniref:BRISC and BRCA1-A complex member 1-like isoform X2 n=1 Tax=Plodia interpunctella TaxID=58824 RepID=UPI0023677A5B|nr:BRISC and BRCA1-A complex member 1-like isoform X2 [Plodia interpunctella]